MAKPTRKPAPAAKKKAASKPASRPAAKPAVKAKAAKPTPRIKPKAPAPKPSSAKRPVKAAPAVAKPKNKPASKPAPTKPSSVKPSKSIPAKPAPTKAAPKVATKPASEKPAAKASSKSVVIEPTKAVAKASAAPAAAKAAAALKGKDAVRARILAQRAKPAKPAAFSLDEVLAIAKTAEKAAPAVTTSVPLIATKSGKTAPLPANALQPAAPTKVKAASLADILGFNPKAKTSHAENEESTVPEKFKRYYKLLIELRNHVTGQVDQHSEETLKRSAKEDSGDLSSYGTDGGTDSFDRDFALSLVANEQEALAEIEAAIQRIKSGTYGICEHTGQAIPKDRLVAVPFTRYTAAAMKEIEKTRYKVRGQAGILGEGEEGGPKIETDGNDE
jgi:RNA polymerase-binding transcription factor DksA